MLFTSQGHVTPLQASWNTSIFAYQKQFLSIPCPWRQPLQNSNREDSWPQAKQPQNQPKKQNKKKSPENKLKQKNPPWHNFFS